MTFLPMEFFDLNLLTYPMSFLPGEFFDFKPS